MTICTDFRYGHRPVFVLLIGVALLAALAQPATAQPPMPTVPEGFTIHTVVTLPSYQAPYLQDVEPGPGGAFGTYLYFIVSPNLIYRVNPLGGTPTLFAQVPSGNLSAMEFGFGGDLYAVDGQGGVPSTVYRINSDGVASVFSASSSQASEGIAYSAGGAFGNRLFVSEFYNCAANGNLIWGISDTGARAEFSRPPSGCAMLMGLEFGNGGEFGSDLYGIHYGGGSIYRIDSTGAATLFGSPLGTGETLAFGDPGNLFGDYLYIAKNESTTLYRVTPAGAAEVFASGFQGFSSGGVTGLEFSANKKMLFVTDDGAGIIYAITFPTVLTCSGFGAPLDNGPVTVNKNRALPFKALLYEGSTPVTNVELADAPPVIEVTYFSGTGPAVDVSADAVPVGLDTEGNQFVFVDGVWRYNLSTKHYSARGTYVVTMEAGNSYFITPTCTASFIVK